MCLNLCYPVDLEDRVERLLRKSRKARAKLGDGRTKPKRMRHRTFARLGREYLKIQHELSEARHERVLRTKALLCDPWDYATDAYQAFSDSLPNGILGSSSVGYTKTGRLAEQRYAIRQMHSS